MMIMIRSPPGPVEHTEDWMQGNTENINFFAWENIFTNMGPFIPYSNLWTYIMSPLFFVCLFVLSCCIVDVHQSIVYTHVVYM